jgi:predicted O-methyltransferase YrrM
MNGAKNILEIGTLGGYSTIWMARVLPAGGKIISLEYNPVHAAVARQNIERAQLSQMADIRTGAAADILPVLEGNVFDIVFIDADKPNNPLYLEWALKLTKPGSIIIGDNVVRDGAVADAVSNDPNVQGVRSFLSLIGENPKLNATAIQTVGSKGYDGFAIAIVLP